MTPESIPLSLYVHIPWCLKKCPYCDFNSHTSSEPIPWQSFTEQLIHDLSLYNDTRPIHSIFFGGGTPSLMPPKYIHQFLDALQASFELETNIEITLEANPGTHELNHLAGYLAAGVNRLSIGVQSFDDLHLKALGRIHTREHTIDFYRQAKEVGFSRINLDLMHGLPNQTPQSALSDLRQAVDLDPEHLSWYQLTIEPNTPFYKTPPPLPTDSTLESIEQEGFEYLSNWGFKRYEVSAWSKGKESQCRHNLNYWRFGDYLAAGPGAHGKITEKNGINRYQLTRHPSHYLNKEAISRIKSTKVKPVDAEFESLLNGLRLREGVKLDDLQKGLYQPIQTDQLIDEVGADLLEVKNGYLKCTDKGYWFLDSILTALSPE